MGVPTAASVFVQYQVCNSVGVARPPPPGRPAAPIGRRPTGAAASGHARPARTPPSTRPSRAPCAARLCARATTHQQLVGGCPLPARGGRGGGPVVAPVPRPRRAAAAHQRPRRVRCGGRRARGAAAAPSSNIPHSPLPSAAETRDAPPPPPSPPPAAASTRRAWRAGGAHPTPPLGVTSTGHHPRRVAGGEPASQLHGHVPGGRCRPSQGGVEADNRGPRVGAARGGPTE